MSIAPRLFDEVIDRTPEMPDWYVPAAKGVLIAGEDMLRAAGYVPGSSSPYGWSPGQPGAFKKLLPDGYILWVRENGKLWAIERSLGRDTDEALTSLLGPRLLCTRTYEAAMRLAEYCHPQAPLNVPGLTWSDTNYIL
jgi:hypothetical protein